MRAPSPVALFVFNRPEHTATTLEALARNDLAADTALTVFCDGPRSEEDHGRVHAVRALVKQARGFKDVRVVERPDNLGLARSIITGVDEMLAHHDTVIVVEDDLTTSSAFLRFMNDGLEAYATEPRVVSVCGYSYPAAEPLPETFFLPGAHCWGWATWRRAWALFEHDSQALIRRLDAEDLIYRYDLDGTFPQTLWLHRTSTGQGDSWALRWMASAIVHGRLTLYPGRSLVHNHGMDGSGTNAGASTPFDTAVALESPRLEPVAPEPDAHAMEQRRAFHIGLRGRSNRKWRLYHRAMGLVPRSLERAIYTAIVRRSLRRLGAASASG